MLRCEPWARARSDEMATVFAAESARWRRALDWDTSGLWPVLEQARAAATLPGLVLRDDAGAIVGWTYAVLRESELLCGALAAPDPHATRQLVDAIMAWPEAAAASRLVCFAYADAPGLDHVLSSRGFALDPHEYLSRPLALAPPARTPGRAWDVRDLDATADLLRTSYPTVDPARPFAPQGRPDQWRRYVTDLVLGHGCGRFKPSLSLAVPGVSGALDAVAIVTDLGAGTMHLAQLAVRPELRGSGVGADMLARLAAAGAAAGFARLTLLVGGANTAARRLYARVGFQPRAQFVSGTCAGAAPHRRRRLPAA